MFSKIVIVISSLFGNNPTISVPVRERVISVSVPEDEIIIDNVPSELVCMYY